MKVSNSFEKLDCNRHGLEGQNNKFKNKIFLKHIFFIAFFMDVRLGHHKGVRKCKQLASERNVIGKYLRLYGSR